VIVLNRSETDHRHHRNKSRSNKHRVEDCGIKRNRHSHAPHHSLEFEPLSDPLLLPDSSPELADCPESTLLGILCVDALGTSLPFEGSLLPDFPMGSPFDALFSLGVRFRFDPPSSRRSDDEELLESDPLSELSVIRINQEL